MSSSFLIKVLLLTVIFLFTGYFVFLSPVVTLDMTQQASVVSILLLLSYLILSVRLERVKTSQVLRYSLGWSAIFLVLFVGYSFKDEGSGFYDRLKLNLFPAAPQNNEDGSVTLLRQQDGHFYVAASVNGQQVMFMIDTGATRTSLTIADAKRLGIDLEKLEYNQMSNTANGIIYSATIALNEIAIGSIVVKDVKASVNKQMSGHSLLGMSFLESLKEFKIEKDQLTMKK